MGLRAVCWLAAMASRPFPFPPPGREILRRGWRRRNVEGEGRLGGYCARMFSTVAVGTDGSETAEEAVKQAADIARRFGAKLVLLSAFPDSRGSRGFAAI